MCSGPVTSAGVKETYCNCIVTCVWRNNGGDNDNTVTKCLLFTFNPLFKTEKDYKTYSKAKKMTMTKKRLGRIEEVDKWCAEYGVDRKRLIYLQPAKDSSHYVQETADIVVRFFDHHSGLNRKRRVIFSDRGNAFKEDSQKILDALGFDCVIEYPSAPHMYISPNDERLHGIAKAIWRRDRRSTWSDARSSIYLMKCLDDVVSTTVHKFFNRNFFIGDEYLLTHDECLDRVTHGSSQKIASSEMYLESLDLYYRFEAGKVQRGSPLPGQVPQSTRTELDGEYWNVYKNND